MKVRNGFVSNSSSSSFIVTKKLKTVKCMLLSEDQKKRIMSYKSEDPTDKHLVLPEGDCYLTPFIYMDGWEELEKLEDGVERFYYCDGEMSGTPYDENYFNNYGGIYLRREHDSAVTLTCGELVKKLVDEYAFDSFIVDYQGNQIIIKKVEDDL